MGFLRRLFGGSDVRSARGSTHQMQLNATSFTRLRDDAALEVVGEFYRQEGVLSARPPGPTDLPPGLPPPPAGLFKAMLIRQPTNQYDPNAIAVVLWSGGDWTHAGYLSRDAALEYAPLFRHMEATKPGSTAAIACDANRIRERDVFGVVLHLGTPGECVAELVTDDRSPIPAHPWAGKSVVFTGHSATTIHGIPIDRPAQLMLARWAGCDVLPRLTKKTHALIVADPQEPTGDLQRAREYAVPIEQEPEFLARIGIPSDAIGRVTARWARG
jgi:hypothetical protein